IDNQHVCSHTLCLTDASHSIVEHSRCSFVLSATSVPPRDAESRPWPKAVKHRGANDTVPSLASAEVDTTRSPDRLVAAATAVIFFFVVIVFACLALLLAPCVAVMCRAIGSGCENRRSHFGHFSVFRRACLGVPSEIAGFRLFSGITR